MKRGWVGVHNATLSLSLSFLLSREDVGANRDSTDGNPVSIHRRKERRNDVLFSGYKFVVRAPLMSWMCMYTIL